MTRLAKQIQEVGREIDLLLDSNETRIVIDEIEAVQDDLDLGYKRLAAAIRQREALQSCNDEFQFDDVMDNESDLKGRISENYCLAISAWDEDRARIRQSGTVGELVQSIEAYVQEVSKNCRAKWQSWTETKSRDFAVSDTELNSIRNVPEYKKRIGDYKEGSDRFREDARSIPTEASDVRRLIELAKNLSGIKTDFKFDLPRFVLDFFDALDSDNSFPLSKLSDELLTWLEENDELKNLSVTRRGVLRTW